MLFTIALIFAAVAPALDLRRSRSPRANCGARPCPTAARRRLLPHSARLLNVMKRSDGINAAAVSFLQNQSGRGPNPYNVAPSDFPHYVGMRIDALLDELRAPSGKR